MGTKVMRQQGDDQITYSLLAVYSPSVWVIRESEQKGYAMLPEPLEMSFIAMAAYRRPGYVARRKKCMTSR